jgi:hypothetical protein
MRGATYSTPFVATEFRIQNHSRSCGPRRRMFAGVRHESGGARNLKESRKIFAYPYFTPSGQKCPAEGTRFRAAVLLGLSALIRGLKWRRLKSPLLCRTPHGIAPVQFYTRLLRVPLPVRNDCSSLYLMAKMRWKSGPAMIGIFS